MLLSFPGEKQRDASCFEFIIIEWFELYPMIEGISAV